MGKQSRSFQPSVAHNLLDEWNIPDERALSTPNDQGDHAWDDLDEPRADSGLSSGGPPSTGSAARLAARFELECSRAAGAASLSLLPHERPTVARSLEECDAADSETTGDATGLPGPGDVIAGFKIVLELGRGAFARVFLAEEINLGRRLVAIKVSRAQGDEPKNLARLQHANIVPVHSVLEDPETGLRILCMPYFGGANLAEVLDRSGGLKPTCHDGKSLIEAIDLVSRSLPAEPCSAASVSFRSRRSRRGVLDPLDQIPRSHSGDRGSSVAASRVRSLFARLVHPRAIEPETPPPDDPGQDQPCRQFLASASAIQAAVWIMARLAEGLDHAHARGLLHRDIKPANILMASDGTPMLLDFNLAVEHQPATEGGARRALIGGTLPYMSPEHMDAFNPRGDTPPDEVDERSDIYALGIIFFEILTGEHPFPDPPPGRNMLETLGRMREARRRPPSLREHLPQIPWSLDSLAAKCLSFDPDTRYQRARDLAEDLRRFLENLPMKHCPEPSLRERSGKWIRRHPGISSASSVAILSVLMLGSLATGAHYAYEAARGLAARVRTRAFERDYTESQFLLSAQGLDPARVKHGLETANRTLDGLGLSAEGVLSSSSWLHRLEPAERDQILGQAVELVLLEARARVRLAARLGSEADRERAVKRAIERLDKAERLHSPPPGALYAERARYHAALGDAERAAIDREHAEMRHPVTCHDLTILGESQLASGDAPAAEDSLRRALALDVTSFWTWFVMGHCHFAQGRFLEAAGDFAACSARGPRFAWTHFNRGLALARAGRLLDAKQAYDLACALEPDFALALVDRGLVELELDQPSTARADLEHALELGSRDVVVLTALGEALARLGGPAEAEQRFSQILKDHPNDPIAQVARGLARLHSDPTAARADFTHALDLDPRNARALYGMALLERATRPQAALDHLEAALAADPNLIDAVQLRALVRGRQGDPATIDDVERLLQSPTPNRSYNAACALALLARKTGDAKTRARAVDLLARAFEGGCSAASAAADPDLEPLHQLPSYQRLIERLTPRD